MEAGFDNCYFLHPGTVMPNYRDVLCCFQPCCPQTVVQPSTSEMCRPAWFVNDQHHQVNQPDSGQTTERFEARLQRLVALNGKLSALAQDSYAKSGLSSLLSARLKQNKFFPRIRNALISKREPSFRIRCDNAPPDEITTAGFLMDAGQGNTRLVSQVSSLQALEAQTLSSLIAMLRSISDEVPLHIDDIHSIIGRTNQSFAPAKSALASAIKEKANPPMPRSMRKTALLILILSRYHAHPSSSHPSMPR
jgi:hypothetical protein